MNEIKIRTSPAYSVFTGSGFIDQAGTLIKKYVSVCKALIISDETVFSLYGERLVNSLLSDGFNCEKYIIAPGEQSKSAENLFSLWNTLQNKNFTRSDLIISLGGGVVSDLGGFAAATYMRGIKHIIFSTTLLSMADAGVGGKTAINLNGRKNTVGTFYEPAAVFCDTDTLKTLPENIYADGMAEIIKCGFICSPELLTDIENNASVEKLLSQAVEIKKYFVELDEKDTGIRHKLNFGHTLAHSAEMLSNGTISHGSAVAMGMAEITAAAVRHGLCEKNVENTLLTLLKKYNLPSKLPFNT